MDKVYGELHGQLTKQHSEIRDYLAKVKTSVSLGRNLLKRGSIQEILASQKVIDKNIEKLGNEQPENLVPVSDGGIQYVPKDVGSINYDDIVSKLGDLHVGKCELGLLKMYEDCTYKNNILLRNKCFLDPLFS